ncbi:hypothetical protein B9Z19DRAFT_893026, partial [Tuber borchii]
IITALEKIKEEMAGLHRGVEAALQNSEAILEIGAAIQETQEALLQGQVILRQQQVCIIQSVGLTDSATAPSEKNRIARLTNRRANRDNTVLEPLYGLNGQSVPGFPRTLGDAKRL